MCFLFCLPHSENNIQVAVVRVMGRIVRVELFRLSLPPIRSKANVKDQMLYSSSYSLLPSSLLVVQGIIVSMCRLFHLSTPLEKTGNGFGVELPEEIDLIFAT